MRVYGLRNKLMAGLKVLNLYAGIGGNRRLWGGVYRDGC
jgi:hypothetical protein